MQVRQDTAPAAEWTVWCDMPSYGAHSVEGSSLADGTAVALYRYVVQASKNDRKRNRERMETGYKDS